MAFARGPGGQGAKGAKVMIAVEGELQIEISEADFLFPGTFFLNDASPRLLTR